MNSFWEKRKKIKKWLFLGHFWANFGYVSRIPAMRFWSHCTYRTLIWCRITVENFVRIVWTVFEKSKKVEKWLFFGQFWANFGYVSLIPAVRFWSLCTRRGPFGCRMTVQNFVKIVRTLFVKFEIVMKRSGEKKNKKKHHDCISSQKFFPTLKRTFTFYKPSTGSVQVILSSS